jgi:hypothetical protein
MPNESEPKPIPWYRRWRVNRTPEQKAAWRKNVSIGTSVGMDNWHAKRTPAQRERSRQLQIDAAICRTFTPHTPGHRFEKGNRPVADNTPAALALRSQRRVIKASVKRIMDEIVSDDPELIRNAIIDGLQAPAPRSFPYIALAAAYLDGKPIDAKPVDDDKANLCELTIEQLRDRALALAERLREKALPPPSDLPVIDITPEESK